LDNSPFFFVFNETQRGGKSKKSKAAPRKALLCSFCQDPTVMTQKQEVDSSPHCCDNRTDLIRTARINPAQGFSFGTQPFHRRKIRADLARRLLFSRCASIISVSITQNEVFVNIFCKIS